MEELRGEGLPGVGGRDGVGDCGGGGAEGGEVGAGWEHGELVRVVYMVWRMESLKVVWLARTDFACRVRGTFDRAG